MILATWNFVYTLKFKSMETIHLHYVRHPMSFIHDVGLSKIHFQQSGPLQLIIFSRFVRFISSMESLSKG